MMTTVDRYEATAGSTGDDPGILAPLAGDVGDFVAELAELARANLDRPDDPVPLMAGTFAMYPMVDGGVMFVSDTPVGPIPGVQRTRIPPGMIRATAVLMGGGSKLQAVRALMGRGRRKAIEP